MLAAILLRFTLLETTQWSFRGEFADEMESASELFFCTITRFALLSGSMTRKGPILKCKHKLGGFIVLDAEFIDIYVVFIDPNIGFF